MEFTLFEDVVLLVDLPEEGVLAGDIGVVVEKHEVPGPETGYSVEFFNMSGDTAAVVVVPASQLRCPWLLTDIGHGYSIYFAWLSQCSP
jgi:hypothetical protein